MTTLVKQILGVHQMLAASRVAHAFGGALALAFHVGEPRATLADAVTNLWFDLRP